MQRMVLIMAKNLKQQGLVADVVNEGPGHRNAKLEQVTINN